MPLSEMFNYVSTLRGMTKGRAQYTMQVRTGWGPPQAVHSCCLLLRLVDRMACYRATC